MSDTSYAWDEGDPQRLAGLMSADDPEATGVWAPEELRAVYKHQMSAAVEFDLGSIDPARVPRLRTLCAAEHLLVRSFNDLLNHPHPPLELLRLTKDFAKANSTNARSPIPREVSTVLYFGCIAAAIVRCHRKISHLPDAELCKGLAWVESLPWVDDAPKSLCRECAAIVRSPAETRSPR